MSYILDALKKAERERHLAQVPTLMTVHSSALGSGRRVGLWVVGAVILAGGGLSIWLLRPSPSMVPPVAMDSRTGVTATLPASPVHPEGSPAPPRTGDTRPPASETPAPSGPSSGNQPEALQPRSREPAVSPRPTQVPPPRAFGPGGLPGDVGPARAVESEPVRRAPDPFGAASKAAEPSARPQTESSAGADRIRAGTAVPSPHSPPPNPPTLGDGMAKMKLDILVYTDVPADRMVIINGQKYVVGQHVDGLYLLEAITREGAVLSYQGERAVLPP